MIKNHTIFQVESPIPVDASGESGAESVNNFMSQNTAYLEAAETLNDPILMGSTVTTLIVNLPKVMLYTLNRVPSVFNE